MCLFIGEELKASSKGLSELAVTVCHCFQVQYVTEILSFVGELASLLEYCLSFQVYQSQVFWWYNCKNTDGFLGRIVI